MGKKPIRVLLGKVGLDGHDNGIRIVAKWLSDAGMEVTSLGLHNSAESILSASIQEHVDIIGCSFLGGEAMSSDDVNQLKSYGVDAVFTPGTRKKTIIETIFNLNTVQDK